MLMEPDRSPMPFVAKVACIVALAASGCTAGDRGEDALDRNTVEPSGGAANVQRDLDRDPASDLEGSMGDSAQTPGVDADAGDSSDATRDRAAAPTPPPPERVSPGSGILSPTPFAPPDGLRVDLVPFASGFVKPVDIANPTNNADTVGNLWIVEQRGTVRRIEGGRPVEPPVLDLRDRVEDGANEQGLLGIAVHPFYFVNGRVFVNYTTHDDATIVSEFFASPDQDRHGPRIDPSSERVVLRIPQPARNHNGGQIAFGPDGYLYIGMGDGGGANDIYGNAQDPTSLLGKMLRIDIDAGGGEPYGIPPDNPFLDSTSFRPEIWAWGLRNPWRFSFGRAPDASGISDTALFIGDVGQGSWEEIDFVPLTGGGANFGWPILEGSQCFQERGDGCDPDGATLRPIVEYPQGGGNGCSVTGGVVVPSHNSPIGGSYLFADYCSGRMWIAGPDAGGAWSSTVVADTGLNISGFGIDGTGEVYVLSHGDGRVLRVEAAIE